MECYIEGCTNEVKWLIWVDDSFCCDEHANDIGSYVDKLSIPEAIPEAIPEGELNDTQ